MDEATAIRTGDFLLSVLGLAASRDLFRDTDGVLRRTAEMRQVMEHAGVPGDRWPVSPRSGTTSVAST